MLALKRLGAAIRADRETETFALPERSVADRAEAFTLVSGLYRDLRIYFYA